MFYIKSDDIEELFREAAEKYHIDTEAAAAWDDVHDAVHSNDQPAQPPPPPEDKRKRRWLSLGWLLLIPLGWFAHNVWNDINEPKIVQKQQVQATPPAGKPVITDNSRQQSAGDNKATAGAANKEDDKNSITEKPSYSNTGSLPGKTGNGQVSQLNKTAAERGMFINKPGNGKTPGDIKNNKADIAVQGGKTGLITGGDAARKNNPQGSIMPGGDQAAAQKQSGAQPADSSVAANNNAGKAGDVITAADANKKSKQPSPKGGHYFYTGFTVAPDVSFIHFQKTSPIGIGGGILLGYHFNNRLSVETGLLFDRKNYYTSAKHFDKSKIPFFNNNPGAVLHSVSGDCNMFEIPVNLKYSFLLKNKNSMYAIAGLSSYLMGHEYYDFDYTQWGAEYSGGRPYDNHNKSWFSIINLGLGYERKLGSKTNLRIEPYVKVPVSGAGTGNISITSTGLYLGLTRRIP